MIKKVLSLCVLCSLTAAFAADPFWKDDVVPDLTRSADSTDSLVCETEVEGRPFVQVLLSGFKFRTVYAPGFLLLLK